MPPIRSLSTAKPVRTERTHEENQERAYIAASRRSDRSLEARIESARRASEIHKKRTGRSLRVTEQDVVNEEMYEEEDDDIPSQYARLSAHIQTNSIKFNRKLHDYISTQTAVRDSFWQQYPPMFPYAQRFQHGGAQMAQDINPNAFMGHQMPPPSMFNQNPQTMHQTPVPGSPHGQHQSSPFYSQTPYAISPRLQTHQRSASIPTPQQTPGYPQSAQHLASLPGTPQGNDQRRMSTPPDALGPHHMSDSVSRPPLSRSTTSQRVQTQSQSPQHLSPQNMLPALRQSSASNTPPLAHETPQSRSGTTTPMSYPYLMVSQAPQSQVLNTSPLSMSLPPETQQFVGSALDPSDPTTTMYMAGSEHIPQPYGGTYTYNPNVSPKSSRPWSFTASDVEGSNTIATSGMDSTLSTPETLKVNTAMDSMPSTDPFSALTDDHISPSTMLNSAGFDYGNFNDYYNGVDFPQISNSQGTQEDFDPNAFITFPTD